MSGRHENGHGAAAAAAAAAAAVGGGGGGRAGDGDGDAHEDDLVMPGFRFHPTEEELIEFYLRRKVEGKRFNVELITFLDLYRYDPWELPAMAAIGEKEWFFYVPRDRKYRNGDRPNRVTASGYWKATGADRMIRAENNRPIGLKKTLVFYSGKAPKGVRSSWIMNEYRLPPDDTDRYHKTEISLCRVYKRTGIDDGHGHGHPSSARSTPSRGGATAQQADIKQASSSSTPTPPTTPSKMMHLLHGECTSPPAIKDHAAAHNKPAAAQRQLPTKPCNGGYLLSTASSATAAAGDPLQVGTTAMPSSYEQSRNASAFASTYSLLSLMNAASSMGGSSAAAIDELSSLVGHGPPAYFNHQAGGVHSHSFLPLPTPSSQPMAVGTLPMSLAAISDKIWEWNPIPDAAARDYSIAGFK
ncbi:NAC domain-containing protein 35 [Dichanthelium oligosanthes]|uniref:NAC domain-containing protein 35 n=1 Tax=Dichanthelium oligosanthes TaxID=888268 RepID=A0A1E5WH59_9POAL|nr:NAC domain-containing protein 35 [Dichanthelium oligosanthes]